MKKQCCNHHISEIKWKVHATLPNGRLVTGPAHPETCGVREARVNVRLVENYVGDLYPCPTIHNCGCCHSFAFRIVPVYGIDGLEGFRLYRFIEKGVLGDVVNPTNAIDDVGDCEWQKVWTGGGYRSPPTMDDCEFRIRDQVRRLSGAVCYECDEPNPSPLTVATAGRWRCPQCNLLGQSGSFQGDGRRVFREEDTLPTKK